MEANLGTSELQHCCVPSVLKLQWKIKDIRVSLQIYKNGANDPDSHSGTMFLLWSSGNVISIILKSDHICQGCSYGIIKNFGVQSRKTQISDTIDFKIRL